MEYPNWIWHVWLVVTLFLVNRTECVLNGKKVEKVNEFNYVVGIQIEFEETVQYCGGAILNDYMILTAAHCLVNGKDYVKAPEKVKIRLRSLKNSDTMLQSRRYARRFFLTRAYVNGNTDEDIAVIEVTRSMKLDKNSGKLQKVELPQDNYRTDGDKAVLAGYGVYAFENDKPITDHRLRWLNVEAVPNHRCPTHKMMASKKHICGKPSPVIKDHPQGMCMGDSGSPLVIKNRDKELVVIGVASNVEDRLNCNNKDANGYYTRVSQFVDWIRRILDNKYDAYDTAVTVMPQGRRCFW